VEETCSFPATPCPDTLGESLGVEDEGLSFTERLRLAESTVDACNAPTVVDREP